jgi:hypothetical protein
LRMPLFSLAIIFFIFLFLMLIRFFCISPAYCYQTSIASDPVVD